MRDLTEDKKVIKNIKCINFDTCKHFTTENLARDLNGKCPICYIKGVTTPYTLDELDEINAKRKSHNVLY